MSHNSPHHLSDNRTTQTLTSFHRIHRRHVSRQCHFSHQLTGCSSRKSKTIDFSGEYTNSLNHGTTQKCSRFKCIPHYHKIRTGRLCMMGEKLEHRTQKSIITYFYIVGLLYYTCSSANKRPLISKPSTFSF